MGQDYHGALGRVIIQMVEKRKYILLGKLWLGWAVRGGLKPVRQRGRQFDQINLPTTAGLGEDVQQMGFHRA